MSIITSLLDTDIYCWRMFHAFNRTIERLGIEMPWAKFKFKCRGDQNLVHLIPRVKKEIESFKKLELSSDDAHYLYGDFGYEDLFNLNSVDTRVYDYEDRLNIEIEGPLSTALLFEVPTLAAVNQLYFAGRKNRSGVSRWVSKSRIFKAENIQFVDFGTRRRFSKQWHAKVLAMGVRDGVVNGTSNPMFAKAYGIRCVGSQAHLWFQAFQVLSRNLRDFQVDALNHWLLTFRGKFNIALSDIIGIDAFLADFDKFFLHNYNGLRHDSGDPFRFIDKVFERRKALSDLCFKKLTLLFSDSLDVHKCVDIKRYCNSSFGTTPAFGIGTNFTNDVGPDPLNIVIKLVSLNGRPTAKLSDSPGKGMCENPDFENILRRTFCLKK